MISGTMFVLQRACLFAMFCVVGGDARPMLLSPRNTRLTVIDMSHMTNDMRHNALRTEEAGVRASIQQ